MKEYLKILEVASQDIKHMKVNLAHSELSADNLADLCKGLQDRELKSFDFSIESCTMEKQVAIQLFDWFKYGLFVEDELVLNISK